MAGQSLNEVLGKKATAARREQEARVLSPSRALRRALSRSADALWGLAITADGMQQEQLMLDACLDGVPRDALLIVLDGPEGAAGAVVLDRATVRSLIEVQTIGRVTNLTPDARALTPTDAAMCAPLLDEMLRRFSDNLEGHPAQGGFAGFRFGAMVEDTRTLAVLLEASEFHSFLVSVEIGDGMRRGEILLLLPVLDAATPAATEEPPRDPRSGKNADRLQMVEARLDAVLCRIRMSLSEAGRLRAGDLLALPDNVLNQVELVAGTAQVSTGCRLGQMSGFRAVRLRLPARAKSAAPPAEDPAPAPAPAPRADKAPPPALTAEKPPRAMPDLPEIPDLPAGSDMSYDLGEGLDIDDALLKPG